MKATIKRELHCYFTSPIGFGFIAAVAALYGFFYYQVMMSGSSSYVTAVYSMLFSFDMMLVPILTMRTLSEEKKNHTDQAFLTAPVEIGTVIAGKFIACFCIFFAASTLGLFPAVAMSTFSSPPWGMILGNYFGTLCYGGAMIAIGIFISGLTVNQIVAAVATFTISIFLMYMDSMAAALNNSAIIAFIGKISFYSRYTTLIRGIFSIESIVYFLSIIAVFLFCATVRLKAERSGKWSWKSLYAVKTILILIAVIVVNIFVSVLTVRFPSLNMDMTAEKLNTLSEEEYAEIDRIDQKVEIFVIADETAARTDKLYENYGISYSQVSNLLDRMVQNNRNISVVYKEPTENPAFMNEYAEDNLTQGDVLIVSDLRHRVISVGDMFVQNQNTATGEYNFYSVASSALVNGLAYVTMDAVPVIAVAGGHEEMIDNAARAAFDKLAEDNAFSVEAFNILTEEIPAEASVLFIPVPTNDYTEEEIDKLRDFVNDKTDEKTHTILFASYPGQGNIPRLKSFLEEWGTKIEDGVIAETDDSRMFLNSANTPFVKNDQTILSDQTYTYLLAPMASPLSLTFENNNGITAFSIWSTADTCYVQTDDNTKTDSKASYSVATYAYKQVKAGENNVYRNVIVMGSSMALISPYVDTESFGNYSYIRDLLRVASNTKSYTAVSPTKTVLNAVDITASRMTINVVGLGIFTIAIPAFLLLMAIIVTYRRRHL